MRRLLALASAGSMALLLMGPSVASANNDPHRFFLPSGPVDIPAEWCGFPVHMDVLVNREYGTDTILPDGSDVLAVTGSFVISLTGNAMTVEINSGGPGTFTISPDGTTMIGAFRGRSFLFAPNLTDFGFPSNVVAVAGPVQLTQTIGELAFTSITGSWNVITDVCAALS